MQLDFTCTATLRPELLHQTLESFAKNLRECDFGGSRIYLNVDPAGPPGCDAAVVAENVRAVASEHIGTVVVHMPAEPSFPRAFKWCLEQPEGMLFFHLEDDWLLKEPVCLSEMVKLMAADQGLSVVNLRAYNHEDNRLCLAPGLWRTAHARLIASRLRLDANPERQLRPACPANPHGGAHVGCRGKQYPEATVLKDIGRPWMREHGMQRDGGRLFTQWSRK